VPALLGVREVVDELAAEMIAHMEKEEVVLFPMVLHLASDGDLAPGLPADAWEGPVTAMERDHDEMARLLDTLRVLTGDFTPPADACNSFRGLYQALADLEAETQLHVHLENNVLFPRLAEELGTVPVAAAAG
jgi:regulator of cell morphogenesis and NO signaling